MLKQNQGKIQVVPVIMSTYETVWLIEYGAEPSPLVSKES